MQGFTLFEVLIASTISALIGAILVGILVQNNGIFVNQSTRINQSIGLNDATDMIKTDIRLSSNVASGYPAASPTYTSSSSTLVLAIPSIDSSGNIISNTFDYIVITQDSAKPQVLRELTFPDAQSSRKNTNRVLLASLSKVTFLFFDKNGNSTSPTSAGRINFTLVQSTTNAISTQQSSSSSQINLRNE